PYTTLFRSRLVMTVSGLTLTLLGTLTVVTFWGNPTGSLRRRKKAPLAKTVEAAA
ncbi:hypothetical protein PMI01_05370, partial [Caulobacter sp. AP07]